MDRMKGRRSAALENKYRSYFLVLCQRTQIYVTSCEETMDLIQDNERFMLVM